MLASNPGEKHPGIFNYGNGSEVPIDQLTDVSFQETLTYWDQKRGSQFAPAYRNFKMRDLRSDTLAYGTLVNVVTEGADLEFIYAYYGTGHTAAKRIDRTGQRVSEHPHGRGETVHQEYQLVAERRTPIGFRRNLTLQDGSKIPQQVLRLPLSSDGKTVDKIFCVCDWWTMREIWDKLKPAL